MQKLALETLYRAHHERGSRYGYLYCHGARSPFLAEWIGQGKRVLDLGCRDGMLTEAFAKGNEVIGADIDRQALALLEKRLGIATKWVDLNQEWPWEEGSFDVIVACELMEHLYSLEGFLENVQATLRKGGVFIGSVPNAFRLRNRLRFLWGQEYETDPTHVRQFSCRKLHQVLTPFFSKIEILPLEGKIFPGLSVTQSTPSKIGALFAKDFLWRAINPA